MLDITTFGVHECNLGRAIVSSAHRSVKKSHDKGYSWIVHKVVNGNKQVIIASLG